MRRFPASLLVVSAAFAQDLPVELKRFIDAYSAIEREAADPVLPEKAIYGGAIPGMLRPLDPHSVFLDPQQFEQLKELEKSTRKGFGSVVSVLPGRVIVLQALPGTPSAKSGIAPGDEILAINGIALARLPMEELVGLLTQSRQREAKLDVHRPGQTRLLQFTLTPEELQSPSVDRAFLLPAGAGYLRLSSFDAQTPKQVRETIEKLGGEPLKALLLDLRDNPGGLLPSALETAALFLDPGQPLLTVRGRVVPARLEKVPDAARPYRFPLVVLINGKSASASEIVAGALQDHGRAIIVGEPSFGKGLVETVYPLSENAGLALTTAYYYTPKGRSIQRTLPASQIPTSGQPGGIHPDLVVFPEPVTRFRAALEASGWLTTFATEFLRRQKVTPDFDVGAALLDELQVYLSERNIRPGVTEWSREREWIRARLKIEIFNQALGVAFGDQVEARRDPVILAALAKLGLR